MALQSRRPGRASLASFPACPTQASAIKTAITPYTSLSGSAAASAMLLWRFSLGEGVRNLPIVTRREPSDGARAGSAVGIGMAVHNGTGVSSPSGTRSFIRSGTLFVRGVHVHVAKVGSLVV